MILKDPMPSGMSVEGKCGVCEEVESLCLCEPRRCECAHGFGCNYKLDDYAPGETICGACMDNCPEAGFLRKYEVTLVIAAPEDESPHAWDWEGLIGNNIYSVNISEKEWS